MVEVTDYLDYKIGYYKKYSLKNIKSDADLLNMLKQNLYIHSIVSSLSFQSLISIII